MSDLEAAGYERRRLLAALLGSTDPPPGVLGGLVGGTLLTAVLVGAQVVRGLW